MGHKGHWGEYTGNAKWSRDHAHTRVTSKNYDDAVRDDAAHIDYLKRDVLYDDHHGHSDEKMTADEKHISRLAGDMKYDKEHHGSAAKHVGQVKAPAGEGHNKDHEKKGTHHHRKNPKYKPGQNAEFMTIPGPDRNAEETDSPAEHRKGRKHWHKKEGESNTDFRNRIGRGGKKSTSYENHPIHGWRKKQ